jgi:hypothetical protein
MGEAIVYTHEQGLGDGQVSVGVEKTESFLKLIENPEPISDLIKEYKVKGINTEFKLFRNVLYKIAQVSKLFNAYSIIIDRIKEDQKLWGSALDEVLSQKNVEIAPAPESK